MIIFRKISMTQSTILTVGMKICPNNKKNIYFSTSVHIIVMDREESFCKAMETIKVIKKKIWTKNKLLKK